MNLLIEPTRAPISWQKFCHETRGRSVALDGYVAAGPRVNMQGPWINMNHHEEVSRLETRATCAQVLVAIRQGLMDCLRNERGKLDFNVFVNDCDEDVSLACFLLSHPELAMSAMNPALNRLVFMEDMLDTTAGAYPFPKDLASLCQLL